MKIIAVLIGFLFISCTNQIELIDFHINTIEIKKVDYEGTYWHSIIIIEDINEIEKTLIEINSSKSFKKERLTKYPPAFYEIIINNTLVLGFLPDKQTFFIDKKYYKLPRKLKILESL
ncbi:MAG: hypothetical protein KIT33_14860 [Candidatus Kapabacteria bacterium]|nr:hypothetical protein [Ignavibacteriota bacterium]MCW5886249.1 hypothetical protein [Candidatus Kapabacteria bacterium]